MCDMYITYSRTGINKVTIKGHLKSIQITCDTSDFNIYTFNTSTTNILFNYKLLTHLLTIQLTNITAFPFAV